MSKIVVSVFAVCGSLATFAATVTMPDENEWARPLYTVSVDSGAVVDLQEATVTVTDEQGGTSTQTGVDLSTTAGTIVKNGEGELQMLGNRSSFAGAIHVKAGVLRVSNLYPTGGDSATNYIHSGATLITDYSNPSEVGNTAVYGTVVYEGGTGASGQYGQLVMIKGSNIRAAFPKNNILLADTTWNYNGSVCWDASKVIDLQGHELTINDEGMNDQALYVDGFKAQNPGGFILDGLNQFDIRGISANTFTGNGYFKFINGTPFNFSESYRTKYPIEWKLIAEPTANTELTGGNANSSYGTLSEFPNTKWMSVGGLELSDGQNLVLGGYSGQPTNMWWKPFAIMGKFTGTGGITYKAANANARNWLITLGGSDNTFQGGVNLYETNRLDLMNGGNALPANGGNLKMADGAILGFGAGEYTLPGAEFTGNATVLNTSSEAATGAWTKPVVKKGAGTLEYGVSVGGSVLDVREGTVKLASGYSGVAGLNKGHFWFADYVTGAANTEKDKENLLLSETEPTSAVNEKGYQYTKGYFHVTNAAELAQYNYHDPTNDNKTIGFMVRQGYDWNNELAYNGSSNPAGFSGSLTATNETVNSIDIAYNATALRNHPRYWIFTYSGYIWNDSDSDVTWTVASAFNDHQIWKVNGTQVHKMDTGRQAKDNPARAVFNLTLHPGPNSFSVRTYNQYVSDPNYYCCATNGFKNATIDFGMGYAKSVTESDDVNDYLRFEDDGSGALFTREINPSAAKFDLIRIASGATLDLDCATRSQYASMAFKSIECSGTIVNGSVAITDSLVLVTNLVGGAAKLTVDGVVTFAEGAKIKLADGMSLTMAGDAGEIELLVATEIRGEPVLDAELAKRWRVVNDGTMLKLVSEISADIDTLVMTGGKMKFKVAGDWDSVAGLREGWKFAVGTAWEEGTTGKPGYYGVNEPYSTKYQTCFRVTNETMLAEMSSWTSANWKDASKTSLAGYGIGSGKDWDNKTVDYMAEVKSTLTEPLTNGPIYLRPEMFFALHANGKSYSRYMPVTYSGYLWNDEPTTATWSMLSLADCAIRFEINGKTYSQNLNKGQGRGNSAKPDNCHQYQIELQPGANRFEIYAVNSYMGDNTFDQATNDVENVKVAFNGSDCIMALSFDRLGRGTKDILDYKPLVDSGNGELFTVDATAPAGTQPVVGSLAIADGAMLDLNNIRGVNVVNQIGAVSGVGTIANGNVKITGSITVAKADLLAGKALDIDGALEFGEGALIKMVGSETLPKTTEQFTLVTATGGITGTAALDPSLEGKWTLVQDGNTIILKRALKGMLLLIR